MNNISRNRILVSIIAILLVSNIGLLVLLFRIERAHPQANRPGFTERLKTEVGFTPEQMQVFEPKKKAFWNSMRTRFDEIKNTKEQFYFQMYDPTIPDSVIESRANLIGNQQKELDLQVIRHFKDIRTMCTPKQLPKFDSLLPNIIHRMTAIPGKH